MDCIWSIDRYLLDLWKIAWRKALHAKTYASLIRQYGIREALDLIWTAKAIKYTGCISLMPMQADSRDCRMGKGRVAEPGGGDIPMVSLMMSL